MFDLLVRRQEGRVGMDFYTMLLCISSMWACIHVLLLLYRQKSGKGNLPPGPFPLPIVGNLLQIGRRPNESLAQLAKFYGPLMTLKLGSMTTVVASSAEMAKEVLQKNDQAFSGRTVRDCARACQHDESSMIWLPAQQQWRKLRTICNTQIFTTQRLDANQALRLHKVEELIAYVGEHSITGKAVNIGRAAFVTTLNLLSCMVFSVNLVDLNSDSAQEFKDLVLGVLEETGRPNLADYFPWLAPMDPQGARHRMAVYSEKLYSIFNRLIEQRLLSRPPSNQSRRNDLLDVFLDYGQENGFQLNRREINELLMDIYVAGTDTIGSTFEWAMAELLRNPNVMEKVQSEIREITGREGRVKESDMQRLPYLQAVVKETLRLHPPTPLLIPHKAESDVDICGYMVPKNTQVFVNVWAIARDSSSWVDPTTFMPERFLDSLVDFKGRDFEFFPFGAGRRICPGLPLASRMLHLMLASLLQSFSWKLPDGMAPQDLDMHDKFGITLHKLVPLYAIPESI